MLYPATLFVCPSGTVTFDTNENVYTISYLHYFSNVHVYKKLACVATLFFFYPGSSGLSFPFSLQRLRCRLTRHKQGFQLSPETAIRFNLVKKLLLYDILFLLTRANFYHLQETKGKTILSLGIPVKTTERANI